MDAGKPVRVMRKASHLAVLAMGCLPVTWVLGVLALVVRARAHLGYWPSPYHPDPQVLPFELHDSVLYFSGYAVFWTLFLLPGTHWLLRDKLDPVLWNRSKALCAGGWLAIVLLAFLPPVNFIAWYLD